ncbi:hypothetical protein BKA82DRAFT_993367 [Pisolithus tinctorius]|nr:hypothetical protein BKA82DRAFT_993367 [Pisolithus tinctorius]
MDDSKHLESIPPVTIDDVTGNASLAYERFEHVALWLNRFCWEGRFGTRTAKSLKLVEVSILPKIDEPKRQEARIILETTVKEDMLNLAGNVHGACITYLVDMCALSHPLPIMALSHAQGGEGLPGVSQHIDIIFHAPASLGDKLKLITTTITVGGRTASSRIDLWDATHHRLIASGTQIKMEASQSKL